IGFRYREGRLEFYVNSPRTMGSIDDRIAKIDEAKTSLAIALNAVEEQQVGAQRSKDDYEKIRHQLHLVTQEHGIAEERLAQIEGLSQIETEAVRETLGLPGRREVLVERGVGFIFGVIASLIAAYLWEYGIDHIKMLWFWFFGNGASS
ncbi:MAG: hypothetical protein AAGO57_06345, partial [Pseudomonadota bacterium]